MRASTYQPWLHNIKNTFLTISRGTKSLHSPLAALCTEDGARITSDLVFVAFSRPLFLEDDGDSSVQWVGCIELNQEEFLRDMPRLDVNLDPMGCTLVLHALALFNLCLSTSFCDYILYF